MGPLPPAYLINLDRSTDRLERFRRRNGHLTEVTRFAAVDGAGVSRDELAAAGYIRPSLSFGPGKLGCVMSHVRLWERAAADDRAITVLEDDVVVSHHFERCAPQVIASLPADWDFIAWGNNFPTAYVWVDLGASRARLEPYGAHAWRTRREIASFQQTAFCGGALRLLHAFGTSAYSISAAGARKALAHFLPLRDRLVEFPEADVVTPAVGADSTLCGLYPSIKAFICLPPLAITLHRVEASVIKVMDGLLD